MNMTSQYLHSEVYDEEMGSAPGMTAMPLAHDVHNFLLGASHLDTESGWAVIDDGLGRRIETTMFGRRIWVTVTEQDPHDGEA